MARRAENELNRLRRTVASYVRGLIALGISAQRVSSGGGDHLAISQLIASGIALASQLQRGIVVRVVGAPLVKRRTQGRPRRGGSEEYPEPAAVLGQDAQASDQVATEWEDVVPASLASAEVESQPFALARMLPSIVAAQQSTFRALSSVDGVIARAVGNTSFAPAGWRASPSQTSLETAQRGSPDAFPEGQATSFSGEASALAVGAAFRGAASSIAFNLSSAAHEMTNIALGSQAVGAGFAPQPSRVANEGTGFAPSSQPVTSPSLLQPSITGSADTSFQSASPSSANLGLVTGSASSSASSPASSAPSSSSLPVTRQPIGSADLSAQLGGPSPVASSGRASAPSRASGADAGLNTGPYAVPNGFNSVLSSPAFAAGTQLSMQVRSLASSGSSSSLPLRSTQEASPAGGGALGMGVVPEQYPSSYPTGAAYSLSGIVASLGLGPTSSSETAPGQLTPDEAPGIASPAEMAGGAFVEGSLDGGSLGAAVGVAQSAPVLDSEAGGSVDARTMPASDLAAVKTKDGFSPYRQAFGERWLFSLAGAAGIGGALLQMLSGSGSWPVPRALVPGGTGAPASTRISSHVEAAQSSGGSRGLPPFSGLRDEAGRSHEDFGGVSPISGARIDLQDGAAPSSGHSGSDSPISGEGRSPLSFSSLDGVARSSGHSGSDSAVSREGRGPLPFSSPEGLVFRSAEAALLRGILTPTDYSTSGASTGQSSAAPDLAIGAIPSTGGVSDLSVGAKGPPTRELGVLRLATSLRTSLLAASASMLSTRVSPSGSAGAPETSRPASLEEGVLGVEMRSGSFVRSGTSGLQRRVDRFDISREAPLTNTKIQVPPVQSFATAYLPVLQAAIASRAMLAAGVAGPGPSTFSLARATPGDGQPSGLDSRVSSGAASVAQAALTVSVPASERDLEASLSSMSREGRGNAEGVFFGLEAVAKALSLAASLPSAAQASSGTAVVPPRAAAQPRTTTASRQTAAGAPAEVHYTVEAPAPRAEDWRSAPEEALTRMLGDPDRAPTSKSQDSPQEPDDRELRRKIEKMIEEELRRYGYQP